MKEEKRTIEKSGDEWLSAKKTKERIRMASKKEQLTDIFVVEGAVIIPRKIIVTLVILKTNKCFGIVS